MPVKSKSPGAALVRRRWREDRKETRICAWCGNAYRGYPGSLYCSEVCKCMAYRARRDRRKARPIR